MATITSEVTRINTRKSEIAEALISRFGVLRTDYLSASGATNTKKGLYDSLGAIKNLDYWVEALNGTVIVADLLGTSTVGSGTNPIYLNNGAPTASSSTVGTATQPVYLKNGVLTACTGNIYSSDLKILINSGEDAGSTCFQYPGDNSVTINFVQDAGISLIGSGGSVNVKNTAPVYFINGTQTASTNAWTGNLPTNVTAYYDGLSIRYRLPYAGTSTAATLKLGNLTACPVKRSSSSIGNATTHYAAGSIIGLTYYGGNWYTDGDYDSTDINRLRPYYARYYNGATALGGNQIVALDKDGRLTPLTTTLGTATNKAATTTPFRPESLMYYWSDSAVAANAVTTHATLYNQAYTTKTNTTFNASVPTYNSVYLVGTYSATTGLFTLDNTNTTSWYKFVPANASIAALSTYFTAGKHYIYLGHSHSTANYMALNLENPVYVFDGTNLIPVIAQTMGLQPTLCSTLNVNPYHFYVDYAGGGNTVATKPTGVDAFGCIHLRTATGYYGEILMSSNQKPGLYYRNASNLTSSVGWKALLDSSNISIDEEYLPLSGGSELEAYALKLLTDLELGTEGSPIAYAAGAYNIYASSLPTNITTNYYLLGVSSTSGGMQSPWFSPNIYTRAGKGDLYLKNIQTTSGTTATVLQAKNSNSQEIFNITHRYSSSTAATEGLTLLSLGNGYGDKYAYDTYEGPSKPTATTGNARGELRLYNRGSSYESIYADYNRDFVGTMASLTIKSANGSNAIFLEDGYCSSWFASIYGGNTNNAKLSLRQYSDATHVAELVIISTGDLGNAITSYSSTGTPGSGSISCMATGGSGTVTTTSVASGWPTSSAPIVAGPSNTVLLFRFQINVTIPEGYALHDFRIYPNSSSGSIYLKAGSSGGLAYSVLTSINGTTSARVDSSFSATSGTNYSRSLSITPSTSSVVLTTSGTYDVLTLVINRSGFNVTTYLALNSGNNYSYSYSLRPNGYRKVRTIDSTGVKIYTQNGNSFSGLSATTSAFYYDAGASGIMIKSGGIYLKNSSSWYKLNISGSTVSATAVTSV